MVNRAAVAIFSLPLNIGSRDGVSGPGQPTGASRLGYGWTVKVNW